MASKCFRLVGPTRRGNRIPARMVAVLLAAALAFPAPGLPAEKDRENKPRQSQVLQGLPIAELSEEEAILHALNRLGFGPRPGDIERVRRLGLDKWIAQQLRPESIDDSAVQARLERFPTLAMSASKLLDEFPPPTPPAGQPGLNRQEYLKQREEMARQREERQKMQDTAPPGRPGEKGQGLGAGDPNNPPMRPEEARTPQRIVAELAMAKMTRAIYSERQLYEQMVDFWFNHFNVYAGKGADRWLLTAYERDVIRPHAMGKFKDLLYATAKSPAMLFYLDNWLSADPKAFERMQNELAVRRRRFYGRFGMRDPFGRFGRRVPPSAGQPPKQIKERGLNENYARELMELHTLGVDGGYTQQDVIEVARCFTGWTMKEPRRDPAFHFDDRLHDTGAKTVLGRKINAGGMRDAEQVLEMLARHPNTAKFISTKLARHFVADNPPPELVERMAKTFLETDGDIRAVLRAMFTSPEFWSRQTYRAKIKKPFELVASTARALGTAVDAPLPLVMWTARIGEPLYQCQPPTGYSDKAEAWVNTGALLNRLNFSLALAGNRMRGTQVDVASLLGREAAADPQAALARAIQVLLSDQASPQTRAILEKQLADPQVTRAKLDDPVKQLDLGVVAGLVLGAPEFQRR